MGHYEFHVDGMRCAGCENIIESEITGVRGALTADADYRQGVVEVTADSGSRGDVVTTIESLGYEVHE